jgi:hypothetical protein
MTQREQRTHKGAQRLSAHNLQLRKNLCANVSYCTYVSYIVKSIEQRISTHNLQLRKYLCVLCAYVVKSNETNFKKNIIYACFLAITTLLSQAQTPNTFSEFYMGFFCSDIIELKDSSFIFFSERNDLVEGTTGMRVYKINKNGDVQDSVSFFINQFWRISELPNGAITPLNDSTLICGFNRRIQSDRKVQLLKLHVGNSLDSILSKELNISFPDTFYLWNSWEYFFANTITQLRNGNFLIAGDLVGEKSFSMPFFVEINENFDVINSFYVFDSIYGSRIYNCHQLADGSFIISGQAWQYGNLHVQLMYSTRAFVARIDTMGNVLWRDIIRHGAPSTRNFWVSDKGATSDISVDSTIAIAYFQHLSCPDSATTNSCRGAPISNNIIGRYRYLNYDLNGNVLADKPISKSNLMVWRTKNFTTYSLKTAPKSGGFVFTGNYTGNASNVGFVYRFDQNGDSLWWREPSLRLQNLNEDFLKTHMTKETADGYFIGVGHIHFLVSLATHFGNMQRSFVFKLDSNGCYEPGICPNSMLGVDERVFSSVDGVKIYPNPAERILFVELEGIRGECRVVLRNMQGQSISTQSLDDTYGRNAKTEFDVQHIAAGMYLIEVHGEQGLLHTKKVVIK